MSSEREETNTELEQYEAAGSWTESATPEDLLGMAGDGNASATGQEIHHVEHQFVGTVEQDRSARLAVIIEVTTINYIISDF